MILYVDFRQTPIILVKIQIKTRLFKFEKEATLVFPENNVQINRISRLCGRAYVQRK